MNLYIIEAPVKEAEPMYWAREWVASQSDAGAVRKRFQTELNVSRADIRTTAVEVDTRKDGLVPLLSKVSNTRDGYLFGN